MFGVLRGCGGGMNRTQKREWWAHICGMCLALRRHHGQMARLTTNYDAALLSALIEAQQPEPAVRASNICPLRSFQRADVVAADAPAAQYAATVGLLMATTKINDHLADGDGWISTIPLLPRAVAQHWHKRAQRTATQVGFDPTSITDHTQAQDAVEQQVGGAFTDYSAPTEAAVGAAFRHTALLAEQPANAAPLEQMGRMYGRLMLLLDSYRDYADDLRHGRFNALAQSTGPDHLRQHAQGLFDDAYAELTAALGRMILPRPQLINHLLLGMLAQIGLHTFNPLPPGLQPPPRRGCCLRGCENCDCSGCEGCCDALWCCSCCHDATSADVSGGGCDCGDCCGSCDCGDCCGSCDCSCDC